MAETLSPRATKRADVIVPKLRESDLPLADTILRSAFDSFTGVRSLFGDRDYVHTRWHADPAASLAAEQDGLLLAPIADRYDRYPSSSPSEDAD